MRLLKQCFLLGVAALMFTSLSSAQNSLTVVVLTNSGVPDPSFQITNSSDIQTMTSMLTNLQAVPAPKWPQFGFRGYAVQNNGVANFPQTLRVFQGTIEIYSSSGVNFFADSNGLQSFLQSKASSAGFAAASSEISGGAKGNVVMAIPVVTGTPVPDPSPAPDPSPSPTPQAQPTPLPLSGSEPAYNPGPWNAAGVVLNNNCYAYATNQMTGTFPQPGRASGNLPGLPLTCANVTAGAVGDGLVAANCNNACPNGSYKVALVINPTPGAANDYHWYRQDSNGNWSHKPGGTDATNVDNSGNAIVDPRNADRGGYTTFCGCFCVDPNRVTVR